MLLLAAVAGLLATGVSAILLVQSDESGGLERACLAEQARGMDGDPQQCLAQQYWLELENGRRSIGEVTRELEYRWLAGDEWVGSSCHFYAHVVGTWAEQSGHAPREVLPQMALFCSGGLTHGLADEPFMTVDRNFDGTVSTDAEYAADLQDACYRVTVPGSRERTGCDHAVGHAVSRSTYQSESMDGVTWLKSADHLCLSTRIDNPGECFKGFLMEYLEHGARYSKEGRHLDNWDGTRMESIFGLCISLPGRLQRPCLEGIGDYNPSWQTEGVGGAPEIDCAGYINCPVLPVEQLLDACSQVAAALRSACFTGAGKDRSLQQAVSTEPMRKACGAVARETDRLSCFLGALDSFTSNPTSDRCSQLPDEHHGVCSALRVIVSRELVDMMAQRELVGAPTTRTEFYEDCRLLVVKDSTCLAAAATLDAYDGWPAVGD